MDIQIIQDHVPLRRRGIAGNQTLEMRQGILLGAGWSPRWLDDVSGHDIKIDSPRTVCHAGCTRIRVEARDQAAWVDQDACARWLARRSARPC
jgi:hypothetical protein